MSTDTKYTACCKTLINSDNFWTLWLSQGFIFRIRHRDAGTLYGREGQNPNNFWQLHYSYSNQGLGDRALIRILSPRRLFNSTLTHVCNRHVARVKNPGGQLVMRRAATAGSAFWSAPPPLWHLPELYSFYCIDQNKFRPILNKNHGWQVWIISQTSLDKFEQVWTSLDKFGLVWRSFDKFWQV